MRLQRRWVTVSFVARAAIWLGGACLSPRSPVLHSAAGPIRGPWPKRASSSCRWGPLYWRVEMSQRSRGPYCQLAIRFCSRSGPGRSSFLHALVQRREHGQFDHGVPKNRTRTCHQRARVLLRINHVGGPPQSQDSPSFASGFRGVLRFLCLAGLARTSHVCELYLYAEARPSHEWAWCR